MRSFGSDNHSGVHPRLFEAIASANSDHAPAYGTDPWTEKAVAAFKEQFGLQAEVFFVFNGTAANVLCLRALMQPSESVICSEVSHLNQDECAAPEFFTGGKLRPLPHKNGKLELATVKEALVRRGDQHFSQVKVLSLTQPTEYGTCYTVAEIREFCQWAHANDILVHVDGARLANAVTYLKTTFKAMLTDTGVDAISFGGTKNGLMMGEAVVLLNSSAAKNFQYKRKQSAQLPSKTRFIAAQFETYLKTGLWQEIAQGTHQRALQLRSLIADIRGVEITTPTESNAVFAKLPRDWVKKLRETFFFYVWDEHTFECRLMTSWDTSDQEVKEFAALIGSLQK